MGESKREIQKHLTVHAFSNLIHLCNTLIFHRTLETENYWRNSYEPLLKNRLLSIVIQLSHSMQLQIPRRKVWWGYKGTFTNFPRDEHMNCYVMLSVL